MFKEKIFKRALELYAGRHVVDFVDRMNGKVGLGGFEVPITICFQNLIGFSIDTKNIPTGVWTEFLQSYLDSSCEAILNRQGTLDHMDGGALKAFWGAPVDQEDHAQLSIASAIETVKQFNRIKRELNHEEIGKVKLSIGLNTGQAIVGNFGSKYRFNYTAFGQTVKQAARTQLITPIYGVSVLITEFTYEQTKNIVAVRELDRVHFSPTEKPISLYELIGYISELGDEQKKNIEYFRKGVSLFRQRHWDEASDSFFNILNIDKDDNPSKIYLERCNYFKKNPPPPDWKGVVISQQMLNKKQDDR